MTKIGCCWVCNWLYDWTGDRCPHYCSPKCAATDAATLAALPELVSSGDPGTNRWIRRLQAQLADWEHKKSRPTNVRPPRYARVGA